MDEPDVEDSGTNLLVPTKPKCPAEQGRKASSDQAQPQARTSLADRGNKEYCRIRQYQLDHGEIEADRSENETNAIHHAQTRARIVVKQPNNVTIPTISITPAAEAEAEAEQPASRPDYGGYKLRLSCRIEPRPDGPSLRHSLNESSLCSRQRPPRGAGAVERSSSRARREIAKAAQGRADRHARKQEGTAGAAAAAARLLPSTNGRIPFHNSEEMQRLNRVWARQETLCIKSGAEDAKIYDGIKYERKPNGPFMVV